MSSDSGAGEANDRGALSGSDWASLATAKVEDVVSLIRDRTVTPVFKIVRFVIFGLLAAFIAALLAVLGAAGVVRILDDYVFHQRVWASYLVIGGIFSVLGMFLSRMRHPRT
jgi:hypothetical protein